MSWIIGLVSFIVGAAAGALLFRLFKSDEARVKNLEEQLRKLSEEHESYKSGVHSHFNNTARLLNDMTDSYRSVYQHIANGAQTLCPDYISSQLALSNETKALLEKQISGSENARPSDPEPATTPPLDYAARNSTEESGPLSELYGIEKPEEK